MLRISLKSSLFNSMRSGAGRCNPALATLKAFSSEKRVPEDDLPVHPISTGDIGGDDAFVKQIAAAEKVRLALRNEEIEAEIREILLKEGEALSAPTVKKLVALAAKEGAHEAAVKTHPPPHFL